MRIFVHRRAASPESVAAGIIARRGAEALEEPSRFFPFFVALLDAACDRIWSFWGRVFRLIFRVDPETRAPHVADWFVSLTIGCAVGLWVAAMEVGCTLAFEQGFRYGTVTAIRAQSEQRR